MFADFLDGLTAAARTEREIDFTMGEIAKLGFNRHMLGIRPVSAGAVTLGVLESDNYPEDWKAAYFGGLHANDPVAAHACRQPFPFVWDDTHIETNCQHQFMGMARDAGLVSGISVPLLSTEGFQGAVSVCSDQRVDMRPHLQAVYAMTNAMHLVRVKKWAEAVIATHRLEPRELEALRWVAAGKTDWEISRIMGITHNTARSYVSSLLHKLDLRRRVNLAHVAHTTGIAEARFPVIMPKGW